MNPNAPLGPIQERILTLKELRQVLSEIYASKLKFDSACKESSQPRETMEQYMYTYLNQKYGLRTLIIEWLQAILNAINTYKREDHEVRLFAKILKNECDEEFRLIQVHVKDTLSVLLRSILRDRFPQKQETDISGMMD